MNNWKYKWVLYVIAAVIVSTIAIQIYWNYKNYLINKQQLVNDVQLSLDNSVENYFARLAQNETYNFSFETSKSDSLRHSKVDSIMHGIQISGNPSKSIDTFDIHVDDKLAYIKITDNDSIIRKINGFVNDSSIPDFRKMHRNFLGDSTFLTSFRTLTSRVVVSLTNDSLQLNEIDSIFKIQLLEKKIAIDYKLKYQVFNEDPIYVNQNQELKAPLTVKSTSPYLHFNGGLSAFFTNPTKVILSRILSGILLSSLLVLTVIACLFYLLKIIKHQKILAEVKNDLISNITHEFKTPIATIGVALESIKNFDVLNDKSKTSSYLDMSSQQLNKLNVMVEKLLETATLDSESLELQKDNYNIDDMISSLVNKHNLSLENKTLEFTSSKETISLNVDGFHFENAINNVIDNAIKYGGSAIRINLFEDEKAVFIDILDNGNSLNKTSKDRIFEKFYRIPQGNTHDVKGFGIGLYYTKTIIEKHGGTIALSLDNQLTSFKISLPK